MGTPREHAPDEVQDLLVLVETRHVPKLLACEKDAEICQWCIPGCSRIRSL
jgi:hypothetical protein